MHEVQFQQELINEIIVCDVLISNGEKCCNWLLRELLIKVIYLQKKYKQ